MAPQIIFLTMVLISLLLEANRHRQPKQGNNSFWVALVATIISLGLLYWGGFFAVFLI